MTEDENNKQFVNIMEKLIIKYMLVRDRKQTKKTKKFLETTEDFIPIITNMPDVNLVLNPGVLGYPGVEISQELLSEEVSFHEKYDKPKKKTSIPFVVLSVVFIVFAAFVLTYSFINM